MERPIDLDNGTRLCVDEMGPAGGGLVVQLEGHMAQLISTPASYCERLAEAGLRCVRVDNRDVGRSSRFPGVEYTLTEMADDVHALVAALGPPAVVVGRSMGGAIAQLLALSHPDDVLGLGLFYTFAKETAWHQRPPDTAPFDDEASWVAWERATLPAIAGSAHPFTESQIDALAHATWARGVDWAGFERQRRASEITDAWAHRLGEIRVPCAILHGAEDALIAPSAARRLHEALPDATLTVVPGLGHQQPPALDDLFAGLTLDLAHRAGL